ncbi:MAG: hypothetical protein JWN14_1369, partial [Chthonomonadales bacterium]|nr:hypothetical protein [Chthonomonadales bacterium]
HIAGAQERAAHLENVQNHAMRDREISV